jgi:hypothetical protein
MYVLPVRVSLRYRAPVPVTAMVLLALLPPAASRSLRPKGVVDALNIAEP